METATPGHRILTSTLKNRQLQIHYPEFDVTVLIASGNLPPPLHLAHFTNIIWSSFDGMMQERRRLKMESAAPPVGNAPEQRVENNQSHPYWLIASTGMHLMYSARRPISPRSYQHMKQHKS